MKVLGIVLGSIFGVIVLLGVLAAIVLPRAARSFGRSLEDPAANAARAARVATFAMPRGFHYGPAMDFALARFASIVPDGGAGRSRRGRMTIAMIGTDFVSDDAQRDAFVQAQKSRAGANRCGGTEHAREVTIDARGRGVVLERVACDENGERTVSETGIVPGNMRLVFLVASGREDLFDDRAIREIVGSLR